MMNIKELYDRWIAKGDADTAAELQAIAGDETEQNERFYRSLEFGTGGLRGIIGAGTNRMNRYTVRQATQAMANYLIRQGTGDRGVCISYDSRKFSDVFAKETACVLAANGIRAYLSDTLRPVPFLSYSVLRFHAAAGVMITASHNPPKYNGYKAYCETGEQIAPEMASEIMQEMQQVDVFDDVSVMPMEEALQKGLIVMMDEAVETDYLHCVLEQQRHPEIGKNSDLKIVYTPLHGSGNIPVRRALSMAGFSQVFVVPEQELPDPAFSTVKSPNPEDKEGFYLAIPLANQVGADLIIGTDPDCDRVGALVRDRKGEFQALTGNQTGVILLEYLLAGGNVPKNSAVIKTIVTTYLANAICKRHGITVMDVLTGFKYIGEKIKEFEQTHEYTFLFGFEESYGYLCGTYTRDKDAVVASMLLAEAAAYYRSQGKSLLDILDEIYQTYGVYQEGLKAVTMEGMEGIQKIKAITAGLRQNPPSDIAGVKITAKEDYLIGKRFDQTGEMEITLPKSDVLRFELEDGSTFVVRPSGTEPKIKLYFAVIGKEIDETKKQLVSFQKKVIQEIL